MDRSRGLPHVESHGDFELFNGAIDRLHRLCAMAAEIMICVFEVIPRGAQRVDCPSDVRMPLSACGLRDAVSCRQQGGNGGCRCDGN
jgi:hypothetical protein